jgi:hypothetical protein
MKPAWIVAEDAVWSHDRVGSCQLRHWEWRGRPSDVAVSDDVCLRYTFGMTFA